jgi:uncharacterized protein (DUF1697 family)
MLRGINLGKNKRIKMDDLKELYKSLGFKDVKTYIQSGNIIFMSENPDPLDISNKIEVKIKEVIDFDVPVIIRTKEEFKRVLEDNPFKKMNDKQLYVTFLSEIPSKNLIEHIKMNLAHENQVNSDKFSISLKEIYLYLPDGYGNTKLNNNFFEKKLKVSSTTRNWNTVNKLFDIAVLDKDEKRNL